MLFSLHGENQPNIIEDSERGQAFWSALTCQRFVRGGLTPQSDKKGSYRRLRQVAADLKR